MAPTAVSASPNGAEKAPEEPEGDGDGAGSEADEEEDGDEEDEEAEGEGDDEDSGDEPDTTEKLPASPRQRRVSAKVLAAGGRSPPKFAPRPTKPADLAGRTVVAQKRIGRAWANGPRVDLEHLKYVQDDFARRQDAVAHLRERMAAKSRPGYQLRVQRRWTCTSFARLLLRRHLSWTPCVVATMADAVWDGDILQVHGMLIRGGDVNARDVRGQLVLNIAIQQQHEPITRLLLDRGADLDLQDDGTLTTPLISSIVMGNKALTRKLLARGADVNLTDGDGLSPLAWAAMRGYLELVAQLLELGADVDRQDVEGWTPLHIASFKGYTEVVEHLLVTGGAALAREDVNGFTPLLFARIAENGDIVAQIDAFAADATSGRNRRWHKATAQSKKKSKKSKKEREDLAAVSPKKLLVTSAN